VLFSAITLPIISHYTTGMANLKIDDDPLGPKHVAINTINKTKSLLRQKHNNII
jgi:uncharacterized membrane protein